MRRFSTFSFSLLVLIACEMLLRVQTVWVLPGPYYQVGVETRLHALRALQARGREPDVLFLGSSIVRTNLNPRVFDEELQGRTLSFNGGLSGLSPDPVRFYHEHFWSRHSRPRLVLQGIRWSELQRDQRAEDFPPFRASQLEPLWWQRATWRIALLDHCRLLYHAGWVTALLQQGNDPEPVDERGHEAMSVVRRHRSEIHGQYDAASAVRTFASIRALAQACRDRGAQFALVDVPEDPDNFPDAEVGRAYREQLRELAGKAAIPLLEPGGESSEDFHDSHHMNGPGADKLSRSLAQCVEAARLVP